nr:hypothetical protein [Tanacetum cinerariifolium]
TNDACLLPGKVEEGRANAMEVVEWAGMEESLLLVPCCWERWKRVVGSVVEVVEWTGVEESGGKTVGGKKGLNATVFAILMGKRWLLLQVWGLNTPSKLLVDLPEIDLLENGIQYEEKTIFMDNIMSFVVRFQDQIFLHIFSKRKFLQLMYGIGVIVSFTLLPLAFVKISSLKCKLFLYFGYRTGAAKSL